MVEMEGWPATEDIIDALRQAGVLQVPSNCSVQDAQSLFEGQKLHADKNKVSVPLLSFHLIAMAMIFPSLRMSG
jgi:hypothetical protein